MKVLIAIRNSSYLRFAAPVIRSLEEGGDEVVVALPDWQPGGQHAGGLEMSFHGMPRSVSVLTRFLHKMRDLRSYLHWVWQGSRDMELLARTLRRNMISPLLPLLEWLHNTGRIRWLARPAVLNALRRLEEIIPPDRLFLQDLEQIRPDLILATPAIFHECFEIDYLRAGMKLGIPTVIQVASWDNLTSKGTFPLLPDLVLVWNENQAWEAQKYHQIPPEKLAQVGAPLFDQVFERRLVDERASFCRRAGLDVSRPFILYAGSAQVPRTDELAIVRRLVVEMRKLPALAEAQLLVRPHPNHYQLWSGWQPPDNNVILWGEPRMPTNEQAGRDLYSAIAHSAAVCGLSTSVFLESAILDRPCGLILHPQEAAETPVGRFIHFQYWIDIGFIEVAEDEIACARWLSEVLSGKDEHQEQRCSFLGPFLRPGGLQRRAADVVADTLREFVNGKTD